MNEKEVGEIRRRFRGDRTSITHIQGCYVNEKKEIVSQFNQSMAMLSQEETEKILTLLRRTLSGSLGKNLADVTFETQQVVSGEEHKLLMTLRDSKLKDESAMEALLQRMIQSLNFEGNYLILLAHDTYDVPYRGRDGETQEDASSQVYSYLLCSICPVKQTKPALSYYVHENAFHNLSADWVVSAPELGFLFPAFDDRRTNLYNALYYCRDTQENHQEFVDAVFKAHAPMAPALQRETFQSVLGEALGESRNLDVIQGVHDQLCELIEEHKVNKVEEPLALSKGAMKGMLYSCGVSATEVSAFESEYDVQFGEDTQISPRNLVDPKQMELCTPDVTIRVNPQRSDLVETRIIDGESYILIRTEGGVELNGVTLEIQ